MSKHPAVRLIAGLVFLTGLVVMGGWIFDIPLIRSVLMSWVTMKFITAFCFTLSAVLLYFVTRAIEGEADVSPISLSLTSFALLLVTLTLFFSWLLGFTTGLESLFAKETIKAVMTSVPGRPSIGTMVSFVLIALGGIWVLLDPKGFAKPLAVLGGIIAATGLATLAGYLTGTPWLTQYVENVNSAMAFHTAVSFVLFGLGFILLAKNQ